MDNEQLVNYIKTEHQKGIQLEVISDKLLAAGYSRQDVGKAFIRVFGPKPSISILKLPKIDDLVGKSILLYRENWKVLLTLVFLPNLVSYNIGLIIIKLLNIHSGTPALILMLSFGLIGWLINLWFTTALFYAIVNIGNKINFYQAIRRKMKEIMKFWWINFLISAATVIGVILLIIPGIIFIVWFSCAQFIFFAENLSGFGALKRSRYYVKGYVMSVFWRLLGLGIGISVIELGFAFLLKYLTLYQPVVGSVISTLLWSLIVPIPIIYSFLIYQKLKEIKSMYSSV